MGNYYSNRKSGIALTILVIALLLFLPPPVCAVSKPSVPEFTVQVTDNSYDVPAAYSKDPYTGETITSPSYHVNNQTIIITIKNQKFTQTVGDKTYHLCYNVRFKGHFDNETGWQDAYYFSQFYIRYPKQSDANETVITIIRDYPANAQVDIQVEAVLVRNAMVTYHQNLMDFTGTLVNGYAIYQTSGWSLTKTVFIQSSNLLSVSNMLAALVVLLISVIAGLIFYFKKRGRLGVKHE